MDIESHVKLTAEAIGLGIPPQYLAGVVANFKRSADMAAHVMAFPLPTEVEPAPVYRPGGAQE
jgi:hypothetical protein